jgi:aminopeptidase N
VDVGHPDEVNEIFDTISYAKGNLTRMPRDLSFILLLGACVIRQLRAFVGASKFDEAVRLYLQRFKYSNAVTEDLWKCVSDTVGFDVSEMMHEWTRQVGYPMLSVTELADTSGVKAGVAFVNVDDSGSVIVGDTAIAGRRYFHLAQRPTLQEAVKPWAIPIALISGSGLSSTFLMSSTELYLSLPAEPGTWVKFNAGQTGFYRVVYKTVENLQALMAPIQSLALSAEDRIGIIGETFSAAAMGLIPETRPLMLLGAYSHDPCFSVWAEISSNLRGMLYRASEQPYEAQLKAFIAKSISTIAHSLNIYQVSTWHGAAGEEANISTLRTTIISLLLACDDEEIIRICFSLFQTSPISVPPDMRLLVFQCVVKHGSLADFDAVLSIYRTSSSSEEKRNALQALGRTLNPDCISRVLNLSLSDEVRPSDINFCLNTSHAGPGVDLTWQFFVDNFSVFADRYSTGQAFILTGLVEAVTYGMRIPSQAVMVEEFFADHPLPMAARTISSCISRIRNIANRIEYSRAALTSFFDS